MARKLKVYRTPIGFHDAYVAASSQKAALTAWGSDANLFARGMAEEVTDPALMADPRAHPGEVIRVARGSAAEHMAAIPPATAKRPPKAPPEKPRPPRPSRHALDTAAAALDEGRAAAEKDDRNLKRREAAIAAERKALDRRTAASLRKLEADRDEVRSDYDRALKAWEP